MSSSLFQLNEFGKPMSDKFLTIYGLIIIVVVLYQLRMHLQMEILAQMVQLGQQEIVIY